MLLGRNFGLILRRFSNRPVEDAVNNILYNTPLVTQSSSRRILSCLVTNEPGVLSKISVSSTNVPDLSRMTVVLHEQRTTVEQARKQLEDLVPVWAVLDYSEVSVIEREIALIKVSFNLDEKEQAKNSVVQLAQLFNGKIVDVAHEAMTVELSAKKSRIDAFTALMERYGSLEVVRSGIMAIPRTAVDGAVKQEKSSNNGPSVDATQLPPG